MSDDDGRPDQQSRTRLSRTEWLARNRDYLDRLVESLEVHLGEIVDADTQQAARLPEADFDPPFALDHLADALQLTDFERSLVGLLVAADLRPAIRELLGRIGDGPPTPVTFALAARVLVHSHWSAMSPERPLRAAEIIEVGPGPIPTAAMNLTERALQHLLGVDALGSELALVTLEVEESPCLCPSHEALAVEALSHWQMHRHWPLIHLDARRHRDAVAVAARIAALIGWRCSLLRADDIPSEPMARGRFERRWRRELALAPRVLIVDCGSAQPPANANASAFAESVIGPLITVGSRLHTRRSQKVFWVDTPTSREQRQLWRDGLGRVDQSRSDEIEQIIANFQLGAADVLEICENFYEGGERPLWEAVRCYTRSSFGSLAARVESAATWHELVLPSEEIDTLGAIADAVRYRHLVHRAWRIGSDRGSGLAVLFHGPSGVGKSFAAEVIANDVGLDLYRVDLSSVVSKYIGETEKNMRRVFDAAEDSGAILLFDEADSLFGKRTEVTESKDRWANMAVSYLLTRIETFPGLTILTTNLRSTIDSAFIRRLAYVVSFPFPDEEQREQLWSTVFPAAVTTAGIDPHSLARLSVTGAVIRRIALLASFEAATEPAPVNRHHVRRAFIREMAKLDRAPSRAELAVLA